MRRSAGKYVIGVAVLAGALGYLAYAGTRSGWVYYLDVDQFVQQGIAPGQRSRIHGVVSEKNLEIHRAGLAASFDVKGQEKTIRVSYVGAIPELFQAGRQVVVEGALDDHGVFQADVLLTKCASKYEERGEMRGHPARIQIDVTGAQSAKDGR